MTKMASLLIEGATLGKRHQFYNKYLKEILSEKLPYKLEKIDYEANDVDNLLKIDVASSNRDVEYILDVLKSEDLLYVSRAIKRSTWLITDPQYAHIVNPDYLHEQLFPHMMTKAWNKLMLHIRLNLKDETRVEVFYNYFKDKGNPSASKWLPNCSLQLIEKEAKHYTTYGNESLLKRLCERSLKVFEIYIKDRYISQSNYEATFFLLYDKTEHYLDILTSKFEYGHPFFNAKRTDFIMTRCPQRVIDNIEKYVHYIDLNTFAKHLNKNEIKSFLFKHAENTKLRILFSFYNLKYFIKRMPDEDKYDFIKRVFIDKIYEETSDNSGEAKLCCATRRNMRSDTHCWYELLPFEIAFPDLQKLIRTKSSPAERTAILTMLITCAGTNQRHMHTLLQYYHDKHINENHKFKAQFISNVLSQKDSYYYDENIVNILNNIFHSLQVFVELEKSDQNFIQYIIVYKVIRSENVPEVIETKFTFNTLRSIRNNLKNEDREKVFNYLFNYLVTKIKSKSVHKVEEFREAIGLMEEMLTLLLDWKKDFSHYPWILNTIKEIIKTQNEVNKENLSSLYNKKKSWRKHMFEESLLMSPTEEVTINALKHDPKLLVRHKNLVERLCCDDNVSLKRLLSKIRVYWPESLSKEWTESYLARLDDSRGHRALVCGLCTLMPQKKLLGVVNKYAPAETKINWSAFDEVLLSLRKQFAKNMYLMRPLVPPDVVLMYCQGDYLQYAMPSLNAILYNMSSDRGREYIIKFLNAPVSLQKHGIRIAVTKIDTKELKQVFADIWKSNQNLSIRAILFKQTFKILCKEQRSSVVEDVWEVFSTFIDTLTSEEDKIIYNLMADATLVSLKVRAKFCLKCYNFLNSLPSKSDHEGTIDKIIIEASQIMEAMDIDFVETILLEKMDKKFVKYTKSTKYLMAPYLLCAKNEDIQFQRYEKCLLPLLESAILLWDVPVSKNEDIHEFIARHAIDDLLINFRRDILSYVFEKGMVYPLKMFTHIQQTLEEKLSIKDNYILLRAWKLTVSFVKILESYKFEDLTKTELFSKACSDFAKITLLYLKEDIEMYFSSVYMLLAKAIELVTDNLVSYYVVSKLEAPRSFLFKILKHVLDHADFNESYLLVLYSLPTYVYGEELKKVLELRKIIMSHPSEEVRMHYRLVYKDDWLHE